MKNTPKVWLLLWYFILAQVSSTAYAQADSLKIYPVSNQLEDLIQAYLESRTDDSDPALESMMDRLDVFKQHPINLHEPGQPDLDDFILLSPAQVNSLRSYIHQHGTLLSIYELQVVPGFDLETIRRITPFIRLYPDFDPPGLNLRDVWSKGQNQLILRMGRTLEPQSGYMDKTGNTGYTGDPNKYYFRFLHRYTHRMSFGISGEKDAGEPFFKKSNPVGFDGYSFHLGFHRPNKFIDDLIIGDFTVGLGQGLLIQTGFGAGKTALATSTQRGGQTLKTYSSANEFNFLRGLGAQLKMNPNVRLIVFYSDRKKDGTVKGDTKLFSSFQESGNHRTATEIASEKTIHEILTGLAVRYHWKSGHLAINSLYSHFDHYFLKPDQVYNTFAFQGNQLFLFSIDHQWRFKNILLFGETARGKSSAWASLQGLQWSIDKQLDLAILYRNFRKNYPALYSSVFSENSQANNEEGIYLGMEYKPHAKWKVSAYQDYWRHSWYKFNVNGPSQGYEQLIRISYNIRRKLESYFQFKSKTRLENSQNGYPLEKLNSTTVSRWRFQFNYKVNPGWELRSRMELVSFAEGRGLAQNGWLVYQDLLYHPVQSKLSFTSRISFFNTDDYESRIYAYENDILNNYSVPAFSDEGMRFYFNFRWDVTRNLMIEARCARTRWIDASTIGSGLDEIQGNKRTELKFQLRWSF